MIGARTPTFFRIVDSFWKPPPTKCVDKTATWPWPPISPQISDPFPSEVEWPTSPQKPGYTPTNVPPPTSSTHSFTYPSPTTALPHNVLFDGAGNKIPKTATLL